DNMFYATRITDCIVFFFFFFTGVHIFGLCVTALITDILQLSTGQHTPYWLDVCKPNLTHLNMSTCDEAFILEDICSGQDIGLINAGRKSFPSQHATLAAFAAVYISMYFNTVLTDSAKLLKPLLVFSFVMLAILAGLTRIIQFRNHPVDVYCGWVLGAAIAVYLVKVTVTYIMMKHESNAASSYKQTGPILTRSASCREPSMTNLKRASAEVEVITPSSPLGNRDNMMTFSSSTLPRSHGGSSLEEGRIPRRHASIHASMDSTRSKQLLSQWKNKNDNRKLSLQVMDGIRPASSSSPQRNMELRCSSEPSLRAGAHIPVQVSIQSRPGSSQLVHIPEEENPTSKDQEMREKWLRVTEKTTIPCRPLSAGGQPRLMQVIALSKQQGLLHSPRSEDGGSTVSCTGSIRYRALTDQDPSPPRTGSIVRVEAHPESRSNKPIVKPPSTDGSGSWRWKPPEQRASLRQSAFNLNDLNRHTDSCDSLKDGGSVDGRRSVTGTETESDGVTTIRVTPVEATAASSDGGSDCQSVASSSRESTLRRKSSSNVVHVQDRGPTPEFHNNHRLCDDSNRLDNESSNRFHENLRSFQENPIHPNHPNRQLQGVFGRPSPTPPPTLPRPILTHTPPPTFGLAYKE
uniref:Phospholipid phosphatase related 4a n=1 Tax=Oreochromis niloticus TaxID=8128 RepID=I3KVK2_ORENI